MSSFLQNLTTRRAVKHFGSDPVDTEPVLRAMINAPTSFGMQPYKIIAIKDVATKEKLKPMSYEQAQVTECDTLFVVCARTDVEERANELIAATGAESMRGMISTFLSYLPDKAAWAARQAYIALGFGLAAAAELNLAACPMEGFGGPRVAQALGLPHTVVPLAYLAVGSHASDKQAAEPFPRFRFPEEDLVVRM